MSAEPVVWTEGKTDIQHLSRAKGNLGTRSGIVVQQLDTDMGDDQLLKQCRAMSMTQQERVTIFIFDRDNPDIIPKVNDEAVGYKDWGNNVYSLAIPVPEHRENHPAVCIELYYQDADLQKTDAKGRRSDQSTEFHALAVDGTRQIHISAWKQGKTSERKVHCPILGREVATYKHQTPYPRPTSHVGCRGGERPFEKMDFTTFGLIFDVIETIAADSRPNRTHCSIGLEPFVNVWDPRF